MAGMDTRVCVYSGIQKYALIKTGKISRFVKLPGRNSLAWENFTPLSLLTKLIWMRICYMHCTYIRVILTVPLPILAYEAARQCSLKGEFSWSVPILISCYMIRDKLPGHVVCGLINMSTAWSRHMTLASRISGYPKKQEESEEESHYPPLTTNSPTPLYLTIHDVSETLWRHHRMIQRSSFEHDLSYFKSKIEKSIINNWWGLILIEAQRVNIIGDMKSMSQLVLLKHHHNDRRQGLVDWVWLTGSGWLLWTILSSRQSLPWLLIKIHLLNLRGVMKCRHSLSETRLPSSSQLSVD